MSEKEKFDEIKGNCIDLIPTSHYDYCVDREDDCRMPVCPRMREHEEPIIREETQCPVCGSIVAPHEIELPKVVHIGPWLMVAAFLAGMLLSYVLEL